jgi:hypothetical protein
VLAGRDRAVAAQHRAQAGPRWQRADVAAAELERQPSRAPPPMRPPQLARRRLDLGRT